MQKYGTQILEEELKNKVAADWFAAYDTTQIIGKIDFAVAVPQKNGPELFDPEFFLWAEAKKGIRTDIPAFYAGCFFHRLKVGYSAWTNPFNGVKSYVSYANK